MATTTNSATVTLPTDEQILVVREFDAPRELAEADPATLALPAEPDADPRGLEVAVG